MTHAQMHDLYKEFSQLVDAGDETKTKDFIANHFLEFPEEVQEKIAFAFLQEEVLQGVNENRAIEQVQTQALDALKQLAKEKDALTNSARIEELKKDLQS